jgi:hypothetical protein
VKVRTVVLVAAVVVPVAVSAARVPDSAQHDANIAAIASGIRAADTVGTASLLGPRSKSSGCTLGVLPDKRCSPGAIERSRPASVLCDASFRTGTVRNVSDTTKHAIENEYGLAPKAYGSSLEIDHIVSLELGGSNDIANLYPELAPGFHVKDKLENRLHKLVCTGKLSLRTAQRRIALDWTALYLTAFGTQAPEGR